MNIPMKRPRVVSTLAALVLFAAGALATKAVLAEDAAAPPAQSPVSNQATVSNQPVASSQAAVSPGLASTPALAPVGTPVNAAPAPAPAPASSASLALGQATASPPVSPGQEGGAGQSVLDRWQAAMAAKLAAIDPNAPPVAPPIGPGPSLKAGASGERVDRLAAQLTARGFLVAGTYQGVYDDAVEHGVRDFQVSEGMTADGRVGDATLEAFDRPPALTAAALTATLANVRHLAANAPPEFFLVNIPSQTAYLIAGDKVELSMRVAVGRPSRPTPLLEDRITDVILNPTWTAPTTVLAKDKLPSLRRTGHPGIEGATIYLDGEEVDPALVDWSLVTPDRLRVVQSPGDQNALGRFKFNLTNGESIYLHDTNDHSVFSRQNRALSSGCVRLAEPRRLAELLLGREGWSPERITAAVGRERTQGIGLNRPLPVRIVYWQATVDDGGVVHVYRDIYGHRGQAGGATLAKSETPTRAAANAGTEPSKAESADVSAHAPEAARQTSRVPKPPATIVAERVSQVARCSGYCGLKLY